MFLALGQNKVVYFSWVCVKLDLCINVIVYSGYSELVIYNLCFPCVDGSHRTSRKGILAAGEQH